MSNSPPVKLRSVERGRPSPKLTIPKSHDKDVLHIPPSPVRTSKAGSIHSDVEDYFGSCGSAGDAQGHEHRTWYVRFYRRLCRLRHTLRHASFLNAPFAGSDSFTLHHHSTHRSAIEMLAKRSWTIHQQSLHIRSSGEATSPEPVQSKKTTPKPPPVNKISKKAVRTQGPSEDGLKNLIHSIAETAARANYGSHHSLKTMRYSHPSVSNKSEVLKLIQENDGSLRCPNMGGIEDIIDGFKEYERRFRQENLTPFANVIPKMGVPQTRLHRKSSCERGEQPSKERSKLSHEDLSTSQSKDESSLKVQTTSFSHPEDEKSTLSLNVGLNSRESPTLKRFPASLQGSKTTRRSFDQKHKSTSRTVSFR